MNRQRIFYRLNRILKEEELDVLLITRLADVWYLTGFRGSEGVVIYGSKFRYFLSDARYKEQAKEEVKGFSVKIFKNKVKEITHLLKRIGAQKIGFDPAGISYQFYKELRKNLKGVRFYSLPSLIAELRAVKEPEELKKIQQAVRIAEKALSFALEKFKLGMKELDLASELEYQLRRAGSGWFPFETIVASGARACLPHAKASNKKIKARELVVIDFGASVDGYFCDLTVTISAGEPTRLAKEIYQIVSNAQTLAINSIQPEKPAKEVDAVARDYIKSKGYGKFFQHGLGHGLGLEVHELPSINPKSNYLLKSGMVFTIEPGIYIPEKKLGVRIEDDVVIWDNKTKTLSHSNQPLRVLE